MLSGQFSGTAHLCAENERTELRLNTRRALPEECTAYLLCASKLVPMPLYAGAGSVKGRFAADALLVATGERLLCSGGFSGRSQSYEQALREMRLIAFSLSQSSANKGGSESEAAKEKASSPKHAQASIENSEKNEAEEKDKTSAAAADIAADIIEETPASSASESFPFKLPAGGESPALFEILQKAQSLFGPLRAMQQAQPPVKEAPREAPLCPFPREYPKAVWKKVQYPASPRYYLEGTMQNAEGRFILHAITGEYSATPPVPGFKRFLRAEDGCGYWIRIRKARP